jgi:hypothetical protein
MAVNQQASRLAQIKTVARFLVPVIAVIALWAITELVIVAFGIWDINDNVSLLAVIVEFMLAPLGVIAETVRLRRKYVIDKTRKITFVLTMHPLLLVALFFGYGWFFIGHGEGVLNYARAAVSSPAMLMFFAAAATLSGGLGVLIDFVWSRIENARNKRRTSPKTAIS